MDRKRKMMAFMLTLGTLQFCLAQSQQPAYDVVTIRPHAPGDPQTDVDADNHSFRAKNLRIKTLLSVGYGIREDLISGMPKWAEDARFDLNAKVVEEPGNGWKISREQRAAMLAAVLEDRFRAKVHFETKELPVYNLVAAKGGAKLLAGPAKDSKMGPGSTMIRNHVMTTEEVPMSSLTEMLGQQLQRTVIDKTGLAEKYSFTLTWTPEQLSGNSHANGLSDDAPPSIFTALQEQLGLKLEAGKGPVKTLVVDHIEMPTGN